MYFVLFLTKLTVMNNKKLKSPRRQFIEKIAGGVAALGLLSIPSTVKAVPSLLGQSADDADEWFNKIKGKHRIVFDATKPNGLYPFAWPKVFLLTNAATGTPEKDNSVVVVLRHEAIPYAFSNDVWVKYKFGNVFKAEDPLTKSTAVRNPFWQPKPGDYQIPGFGNVAIGINELQDSGVMFAVCNAAMTVYSNVIAGQMKMDVADVQKDWHAGLLPGVQVVPSGVWAVGRAQEHGCAYCSAG